MGEQPAFLGRHTLDRGPFADKQDPESSEDMEEIGLPMDLTSVLLHLLPTSERHQYLSYIMKGVSKSLEEDLITIKKFAMEK